MVHNAHIVHGMREANNHVMIEINRSVVNESDRIAAYTFFIFGWCLLAFDHSLKIQTELNRIDCYLWHMHDQMYPSFKRINNKFFAHLFSH